MRRRTRFQQAEQRRNAASLRRRRRGPLRARLVAAAWADQKRSAKPSNTRNKRSSSAGRSFYQNGNQWIDATIQKLKDPKRVRVQLNSKEYFDLVAKKSEARPWLALGQNVQFVLNGTVYEIYDN